MKSAEMKTVINGNGYNQFGKEVLITQMRFSLLEAIFEVDGEVQRKLDPQRRSEIRDFILKSVEKEEEFYFSPFIFSARGGIQKTETGWELQSGSKLYIIDGQHRSSGLSSAISSLKSKMELAEETNQIVLAEKLQERLDLIRTFPVSMQIYLNLSQQEERQLFTDINTERKEAHAGIVMQYDQRDDFTILTRNLSEKLQNTIEIEQKLSRITNQSSALTSLAIMRRCLLAMFEGDLGGKRTELTERYIQKEEMEKVAESFFAIWPTLFPKRAFDRKRYVSGISGVQIALAYTVLQLTRKEKITHLEAIPKLKALKKACSWKHDDPLFTHLFDQSTRRIKNHSRTTAIKKTAFHFVRLIDEEGQ